MVCTPLSTQVVTMTERRGYSRLSLLVCSLLLVLQFGCEETPQIHSADQPVAQGGIQFELTDYEVHYLEITGPQGETLEYPDPVLAIGVRMTNAGEDPFTYGPTHDAREMSEARTPLLFPAPDTPEVDWDNFAPRYISGVQLEDGTWERQIHDQTTLNPGDTVEDFFLFELPRERQAQLVLSLPPVMHRGGLPVFLQFNYSQPRPQGPPVHTVGDEIEFDGITFTVTAVTQEYIKLEDSSDGEGFSNEPVLKIAYTVANTSDQAVTFDAAHRDVTGSEGPVIQSSSTSFTRVRFPANASPEGQQGRVEIAPGESIEDFATFERPSRPAETATYILPASHFERSGRVRVAFSYEPEEVELPEELRDDD